MAAASLPAFILAAAVGLLAPEDEAHLVRAWEGIHGAAIAEHVRVLASDEFEGRAPGTHGEELALAYIRGAFEKAGLVPAYAGGYAQDVPLEEGTLAGPPAVAFHIAGSPWIPKLGEQFMARLGRPATHVALAGQELVFAGFGCAAPEYGWNDYAGMDLHGKVVVLLQGDPGTWTGDSTLFGGIAATRHSVPLVKAQLAARLGARAAVVVHTEQSAGYPWSLMSGGGLGKSQHFLAPETATPELDAVVHLSEPAARELFTKCGHDFDAEVKAATTRGFRAHALGGRADIALDATVRRIVSHNLVGLVPGTAAPEESVVLLAHWDHMGVNSTVQGDRIFNGAVDNATGVAALIEVARALHAMPRRPRRTIVLVATTAEERGLLGSEYFARHPVRPLAKMAGAAALDAFFPFGAYDHMTVTGFGHSELDDVLALAAARAGRTLQDDGTPQVGAFYRADQYPFVKRGVPGFQAVGTPGNDRSPETDPQMAALVAYVSNGYHKPNDQYDPATWKMEGIEADARVFFEFAWRVADDTRLPNWRWNSPFRALGDALRHGAGAP